MGTIAERQVAHVWKRLGFGPVGSDIDKGIAAGPDALVSDLLSRPLTAAGDWNFTTATDWVGQGKFLGQQLQLMGVAANPVQERLAWILQGLVVVGIDGTVYFPDLRDHILRLRADPFGPYKQLLTDVTPMAGMMKYLSGYQNSRQHPNQNYARELMELFSLGTTHPRTGAVNYTRDRRPGGGAGPHRLRPELDHGDDLVQLVPVRRRHQDLPRAGAGQRRRRAGDRRPDEPPVVGLHVPRRLYRELVGLEPDGPTLDALAATFGITGDVRGVVSAIVKLPAFLSDAAIGAKAKTPVELVVTGAKVLGFDLSTVDLSWQLRDLFGQHPFLPPNVSGWPAGKRWLNTGVAMTWCGLVQQFVAKARNLASGVVQQLFGSEAIE